MSFHPRYFLALLLTVLPLQSLQAETFSLTRPGTEVLGEVLRVKARAADTLMDIGRRHEIGHRALRRANPDVDTFAPGEGTEVLIPSQFLLPDAPREGIVLNRSEMRLYYFHESPLSGEPWVSTYPVGIGRSDRQTPEGEGRVIMKLQHPTWYPTAEVRADYESRGESLPLQIPAGPENPLGEYAMKLDLPGFLIHGTNKPDGIGMLVSQGCVRLYPEHIESLVHRVEKGTTVRIVDQAAKAALQDGDLWVEVHPSVYPGEAGATSSEQELIKRVMALMERKGDQLQGAIDWEKLREVAERADGIPTVVSRAQVVSR